MKNHLLTLITYSTCCYGSLQKSVYSDAIFAYKEKVLINITCYLNFCCFPKSFIMNLVNSVDSFSSLDQYNKDYFLIYLLPFIIILECPLSFFLSFLEKIFFICTQKRGRGYRWVNYVVQSGQT